MNLLKNFEFNISVEKIKVLFKYFCEKDIFSVVLFVLSFIYILITEKDKKVRNIFIWYIIIVLFIIWNPFIIHIIEEFINFASLYRLYYMIPMYPIIAYSLTKLIKSFNKKTLKYIGVFSILFIMVVFGKSVFNESNLFETHTLYKLPDESVFVSEMIYKDTEYKEKKALVPYNISSHIRQIHPSINLVFTRFVSNYGSENGIPSPSDDDNPHKISDKVMRELIEKYEDGDSEYVVNYCNKNNVNYIVFNYYTPIKCPLEELGFENIGSNFGVTVYRRIKK